ncbi:DUF5980 family protein [Streptomyces xiaopingdaonensis]|uniref:DUF5980 family protein n=1 Tax=Streptomyces xiaopingdaonensis TaxID=1565415 RepID=UPI0003116D1D|nr:DUF5980 family protein [Streptomyces xiaopingdaonensis]
MATRRRKTGLLFGLLSTLTLTLIGTTPASAATATWNLEAENQRICMRTSHGWPNTYAYAPVSGSWSTTIRTGVRNLPPGSSSMGGMTLQPGENHRRPDGSLVLNATVHLSLAPAPVGDYTAEIWASDGTETQTDELLLSYRDKC